MNNIDKEVRTLPPFKRLCMTIGELPTSYVESMTYYESLLWFTKYLHDTVIPAINGNAEAVKELQDAYIELKNYVDTYFDNLDIQTEINNKLDEMAESGDLVTIIATFLGTNAVIGFDTKSALKGAENLAEGVIAKTLGKTAYNDGKSDIYKIRELGEEETPDDDVVLELTNYPTLVAEKLPVEDNHSKKLVMFGDSYANGSTGTELIDSWCDRVAAMMGRTSDYYSYGVSGGAFYNGTLNAGFPNLVDLVPEAERPFVDKVIVGAGANDFVVSSASSYIAGNVVSLISDIKTAFPNAKIYFCFIGYKNNLDATFATVRSTLLNSIISNYAICLDYGCMFAGNIGYILHNSNLISADGCHPNNNGYQEISRAIYNFVETGKSFIKPYVIGYTITAGEGITINESSTVSMLDEVTTWLSTEFTVTADTSMSCNNVGVLTIGTFGDPKFFRPNAATTYVASGTFLITFTDNTTINAEGDLRIGYLGEAYVVFNQQFTNIKSIRSRALNGTVPTVRY